MPLFRSGRFFHSARLGFLFLLTCSCVVFAGERRHRTKPPQASEKELGLKNIPLTIGHEAKGLVLPNYDLKGHLLGRFEAAVASRLDEQHVRFTNLKMISFDEHDKPDFNIDMTEAVLNLDTRVINSNQRTKIKRADFEIAGDTVIFNTVTHQGTLTGNVHMTIFNQAELEGTKKK